MAGKYNLSQAHNHDEIYAKIGEAGVTDHGALTGLEDNDHPQYLLTTGKAADSDKLDGLDSTAFAAAGHDHDTNYLGITAKASDSDKLDNIDSTGFVQTSGDQTVGGIKTFTSIPALPATDPTTANQAVRKSYVDNNTKGVYVAITPVNLRDNSGIPIGVYTVYAPTYGVPLTATAVVLRLTGKWNTVPTYQNYLTARATPTAPTGDENVLVIRPQVSNLYNEGMAICGLSSGYFYYEVAGEAAGVYSAVIICGYFR